MTHRQLLAICQDIMTRGAFVECPVVADAIDELIAGGGSWTSTDFQRFLRGSYPGFWALSAVMTEASLRLARDQSPE